MNQDTPVQEPLQSENQAALDAGDDLSAGVNRFDVIAEARRYRKRAQAAEKSLEDLKLRLAEQENRISEQDQTITALERRQKVDDLLRESDAIDLESARLLTEIAIAEMEQPDIEAAVRELRQRKPHLFQTASRSSKRAGGGAMGARSERSEASPRAEAIEHAAAEAYATGKRGDLLRYLRLRRTS